MTVWDALGGTRAATLIEGMARSGELPHAWLLLGSGSGTKRSLAFALAAALNCDVSPGVGCAECEACLRVLRGRHPDVHRVVPEGPLIPVETIREYVIPQAARSPFEGAFTVFVIEEAERMNQPAQNSLLKTLEEPQGDTIFILMSENDEELLDTVKSRCVVLRLEPVPEDRLVQSLIALGADQGRATIAARLSDGDVERAQRLALDPAAAERRALWLSIPDRLRSPVDVLDAAAEIVDTVRVAVKQRGESQKDEVKELAEAMGEGRGTAAARNALAKRHRRELRRHEEEILGEAFITIATFYRDVVAVRRGARDAVANADALDVLERWAESPAQDGGLICAADRLVAARTGLTRNSNVPLTVEAALFDAARWTAPQEVGAH